MTKRGRIGTWLLVCGFILGGGMLLIRSGAYGWTLFAAIPTLLGATSTFAFRPHKQLDAIWMGAVTATVPAFGLVLLGTEGLICVLMCVPLTIPFGALGGWLTYRAKSSSGPATSMAILLMIPSATLTYDWRAAPQVYRVQSEVTVAASPEQVWKYVIAFPNLEEPSEWYFKTGIAYPQRARLEGTGPGAVRYCEFSTGAFVEPIEVWDEPRLLQFSVTQNPSPMKEWSPFGDISPKHLHGYLLSRRGEFRLIRLENGQTLLRGATWYQHGLWPAEYWRLWSDAIIHRIHMRVLNHVKSLAENRT